MRQAISRGSGRGGVSRVCALDSHLGRLANEVVLHPAGDQMHHTTCERHRPFTTQSDFKNKLFSISWPL